MDSSDPGRLALPTYDSLYFLFGSHAYLSAVAQTRPYGLRHGLDADSQCKPHNENTLMSYVGSASLPGSLESIVYTGLFLRKKLAEDQTDKRTAVKKLPEESYREV